MRSLLLCSKNGQTQFLEISETPLILLDSPTSPEYVPPSPATQALQCSCESSPSGVRDGSNAIQPKRILEHGVSPKVLKIVCDRRVAVKMYLSVWLTLLSVSCASIAQTATAQTPAASTTQQPAQQAAQQQAKAPADSERARVFITDSQSWEIGGYSGSSGGAGGAMVHGGARPQTAEIVKTFGERCPQVTPNNKQEKADYIVLLDHEGGKDSCGTETRWRYSITSVGIQS